MHPVPATNGPTNGREKSHHKGGGAVRHVLLRTGFAPYQDCEGCFVKRASHPEGQTYFSKAGRQGVDSEQQLSAISSYCDRYPNARTDYIRK